MTPNSSHLLSSKSNQPRYRVLVDADILLEHIYFREKFIDEVQFILREAREVKYVDLFITDQSLKRIRTATNNLNLALDTIDYFRSLFGRRQILTVNDSIIAQARTLDIIDIDSAIEHTCATEYGLDAIVTQNSSNFKNADIAIWEIPSLRERVALEGSLIAPSIARKDIVGVTP